MINSSKKVALNWGYLGATFWKFWEKIWDLVAKGSLVLRLPLSLPFYTRYYAMQGSGKSSENGASVSSLTSVKRVQKQRCLTKTGNVF